MIGVAWAGIRFLKGFDIFSRNVEYQYAAYGQINGIKNLRRSPDEGASRSGSVTGLSDRPPAAIKSRAAVTIKLRYRIPTDSGQDFSATG